jgi:hypothetical protein
MSHHRSVQVTASTRTPWLSRLVIVAFIGLTISQTGCNILRSFDDNAALTFRDLVWSKRAYNLRYGNCDRPYSEHFKNGFCAGYSDVCGGGDGYTPALPPESYRGYEFQSSDGSKCVNSWFEGYPAGVAAAKKDNSGSFNDLAVSRMLEAAMKQEEKKPDVSGKVPVVASGEANQVQQKPVHFKPPSMSMRQPLVPSVAGHLPSVLSSGDPSERIVPPVVPAGFSLSPEAFDSPVPIGHATSWNDK